MLDDLINNISADVDATQARLDDPGPFYAWAHEYLMAEREKMFKSGRGPKGPHRPLQQATRRRHRTGVPLWNTKDLGRSFYQANHRYHVWRTMPGGKFVFGSKHPVIDRLEARGYVLGGMTRKARKALDKAWAMWVSEGRLP